LAVTTPSSDTIDKYALSTAAEEAIGEEMHMSR
jgi:hypothetical protein